MSFENKSFKERVLEVVWGIKKGEVKTYKEVASLAGSPLAYRAVGSVLKGNYLMDVPCHRVIKSDGRVGEYNRGGERVKRRILKEEGAI